MSAVRKFSVRNRLSSIGLNGKGMTAAEALRKAGAALEATYPESREAADGILAEIYGRFGPENSERSSSSLEDLYGLSYQLISFCGAFPDAGLDQAARALCDLVDRCQITGRQDWEVIDLHLAALRLTRSRGEALFPEARYALVQGLRSLADRPPTKT